LAGVPDVAREIVAWVDDGSMAAIDYDRDILAHLAPHSLGAIGAAIQVSPRYASLIRYPRRQGETAPEALGSSARADHP